MNELVLVLVLLRMFGVADLAAKSGLVQIRSSLYYAAGVLLE